jgi:hypothetical protein
MKQPKKIIRRIREEIEKVRPDLDLTYYMLADEQKDFYVIQKKGTKDLITIPR